MVLPRVMNLLLRVTVKDIVAKEPETGSLYSWMIEVGPALRGIPSVMC